MDPIGKDSEYGRETPDVDRRLSMSGRSYILQGELFLCFRKGLLSMERTSNCRRSIKKTRFSSTRKNRSTLRSRF